MGKIELKHYITGVILVLAIFSGVTLEWEFDKDWISLSRDNVTIAKEKWVVNAERTWSTIKYTYQRDSCINKGGTLKDYDGSPSRCYFPEDYYEPLKRSLVNTKIYSNELPDQVEVFKESPNYKYGTRGAYAGYVKEKMVFEDPSLVDREYPKSYTVDWSPSDTRNYYLVWRVESLKEVNLTNGEYTDCKYEFGKVLIDVCADKDKLDKVVISGSKAHFYFKPVRGIQILNPILVDPVVVEPVLPPKGQYNTSLLDKQSFHNESWTTSRPIYNYTAKCVFYPGNNSWTSCLDFSHNIITEHSEMVMDSEWQEIWVDGKLAKTIPIDLWCYDANNEEYKCKSKLDCNGAQKLKGMPEGCDGTIINKNDLTITRIGQYSMGKIGKLEVE